MDRAIGVAIPSRSTSRAKSSKQTRRMFFHWYQMSYSEPAILSFKKIIALKRHFHFTPKLDVYCNRWTYPLQAYFQSHITQDCWPRIAHLIPMNKYPSSLMDDMTIIIFNRLLHFAPNPMDTTIGVPIHSRNTFQSHAIYQTRRIFVH